MPPIRPNAEIVNKGVETDRQRELGILRAQQRAARPLLDLMRDLGKVRDRLGEITFSFDGTDVLDVSVKNYTLTQTMLEQCMKRKEPDAHER